MTFIFNPTPSMGQHFTLGAGPAQIMGQHVLPRMYGCRCLWWVALFVYFCVCSYLHHAWSSYEQKKQTDRERQTNKEKYTECTLY